MKRIYISPSSQEHNLGLGHFGTVAQALYKQVAPLSPGTDLGVKYNPALLEVGNSVHATSALIELGFHDNALDSEWMIQSPSVIAEGHSITGFAIIMGMITVHCPP